MYGFWEVVVSVLLKTFGDLSWVSGDVEVWLGDVYPDLKVSSCCVFMVDKGFRLLLVDVRSRSWDLPGGHVEGFELPFGALGREIEEETGLGSENYTMPKVLGFLLLEIVRLKTL